MATPAHDKYYLRTLHQEIDLFDRKLAHMLKYDTFTTEAERATSTTKMKAKRDLLVITAKDLVSQGIEFKASELPRSLRTGDEILDTGNAPVAIAEVETPSLPRASAQPRQFASPFAGGVLDGQAIMQNYKKGRSKAPIPQA